VSGPPEHAVLGPPKRALVTGASRGIGKAVALALADAGYDVAVTARTLRKGQPVHTEHENAYAGSLEETAEAIAELGRRALPLQCDLTDEHDVDRAIGALLSEWGGVAVAVHAGRHVGPGLMDPILDTPLDAYRRYVEAHAIAAIRIAQLLLPPMLAAGHGTFVMISSDAALRYYPHTPPGRGNSGLAYRVGKAAAHMLVGGLLAEHAGDGIRAFNVDPGLVLTERNSAAMTRTGFDPTMAAPPAVIGATVTWLVENPDADALMRTDVTAQDLALSHGLYPRWRDHDYVNPDVLAMAKPSPGERA
jgi:NAD(P)-dependent dehydrogenase (short-subunit alcohol dehydrogenase family)